VSPIGAARRTAAALHGFLFESESTLEDAGGPPPGLHPADAEPVSATAAPPVILASAIGSSGGAASLAAAIGVAATAGAGGGAALLVDVAGGQRRGPTVLASEAARELEDRVRGIGGVFEAAAARGNLCHLSLPDAEDPLEPVAALLANELPASAVIVHMSQELWPRAIVDERLSAAAGVLRAELPGDRALAALAVAELRDRGLRAKIVSDPLGRVASRRALAGLEPGGAASRRAARLARALLAEHSGQGLPLVLGAAAALIFAALVLAAIGGPITGTARAQRAADVAALSGARSMRDDFDRLFAPAFLPTGSPNPAHLSKAEYLARARAAVRHAARMNEVPAGRLRVRFPDAARAREGQSRGRSRRAPGAGSRARRAPGGDPGRGECRSGGFPAGVVERDGDDGYGRRVLGAACLPAGGAQALIVLARSSSAGSAEASLERFRIRCPAGSPAICSRIHPGGEVQPRLYRYRDSSRASVSAGGPRCLFAHPSRRRYVP
jgi:hypothetical protein